jgi:hypothetical protein
MKGYQREKNTQAILATDYSALMLHRKGLEEKNKMKGRVDTLESEIKELKKLVNVLLKERSA